eukprot:m.105487 g.105487  ORF g.105487 m.105487 type:complete len:612 (+) comp15717_c0_seq1:133-1968(+)
MSERNKGVAAADGQDERGGKRLRVSLERHHEHRVQHVDAGGEETTVPELSGAQRMYELVGQFNFAALEAGALDEVVAEPSAQDQEEAWASMVEQVRLATVQVEMLSDVLSLVQKTEYMKLAKMQVDPQGATDLRRRVVAKRSQLELASATLAQAATDLKKSCLALRRHYHSVASMRYAFRLVKSGSALLVDFSYRAAGSIFADMPHAEVCKPDMDGDGDQVAMRLEIPARYRGVSAIRGVLNASSQRSRSPLELASLQMGDLPPPKSDWKQRLAVAQRSAFNQELLMCLKSGELSGDAYPLGDRCVGFPVGGNRAVALGLAVGPLIPSDNPDKEQQQQDDTATVSAMDTLRDGLASEAEPCSSPCSSSPLPRVAKLLAALKLRRDQDAKLLHTRDRQRFAPPLFDLPRVVRHYGHHALARDQLASCLDDMSARVTTCMQGLRLRCHWHPLSTINCSSCTLVVDCLGASGRPLEGYRQSSQLTLTGTWVTALDSQGRTYEPLDAEDCDAIAEFARQQVARCLMHAVSCELVARDLQPIQTCVPTAVVGWPMVMSFELGSSGIVVEADREAAGVVRLSFSAGQGATSNSKLWSQLQGPSPQHRIHTLLATLSQ